MLQSLNREEKVAGKNLVIRLMKEEGIQGKVKRTKPDKFFRQKEIEPYLSRLNRNFSVEIPIQV